MCLFQKKDIIITIILGLVYSCLYDYTYANIIATDFAYDGHRYIETSILNFCVYCIVAVFPLSFYKGLVGISVAYSFFAYIFMYIPAIHTLFFQYSKSILIISYIIVLFVSMILFFKTDKINKNVITNFRKGWSFNRFEIISYVLIFVVLALNISNIQWVNFFTDKASLYELRAELDLGGGTLGVYLFSWVRNVFVPTLLVIYIVKKKKIKSVLLFAIYILFYMIDKQKNTLFLPFFIVGFYHLLKHNSERVYRLFHIIVFTGMSVASILMVYIKDINEIGFGIAAIFVYRVQCIAGIQVRRYIDFFDIEKHEYTYYSHISFINKILNNYPYKESLGYTVSYGEGNSNASFWSMDGIAAGGPIACLLITVVFIIVKHYIGKYCHQDIMNYYLLIILPSVTYFTNVSLFTSLFTGGIFLVIIIFKYLNIKVIINN